MNTTDHFSVFDSEKRTALIETSLLKIIELSPFLFWLVTIDWKKVLYVSPAFRQFYGYEPDQVYKNPDIWYRAIHPDDEDRVLSFYEEHHGQQTVLEYRIVRSDNQTVWLRDFTCPIRNSEGELVVLAGLAEDITEQKKIEDEIKANEQRYRTFIHNLQGIAYSSWMDSNPHFFHGAVEEITGYTEKEFLERKPSWDEIIYPEDRHQDYTEYKKKLHTCPNFSFERDYRIQKKDGSLCWVHETSQNVCDAQGKPVRVQGMIFDISERKRAEEAIRKSEEKIARLKTMESLGLLVGGVAHDLNNILSGIVSYPELMLMKLPEDSSLRGPIATILDSGNRAAAIVQDLLTVARGVATVKTPLLLNDVVLGCVNSPEVQSIQAKNPKLSFRVELDDKILKIKGSDVHLKKAVTNLIYNASEAIQGEGVITISTGNAYLDVPLSGYDEVNTGEYCVLSVSDDGPGISKSDLEKIFEPFYSKKVMGRSGTGLGLTVVWNTVKDHNGYIDVINSKNGVTFQLYYPITRDDCLETKSRPNLEQFKGNGETILVVDDEENQRKISCEILNGLGYNAISVSSGEEAIEILKKKSFDMLLLDMIMKPGINGRETYKKVIEICPGQKAILASGFVETEEVQQAQELGAGQFIKKPFTIEKIGQAIKDELGKGES